METTSTASRAYAGAGSPGGGTTLALAPAVLAAALLAGTVLHAVPSPDAGSPPHSSVVTGWETFRPRR